MLKLAKVFTNHMVLQRNKPIKIFGLADGEVRVSFDGETVFTKPENGKWVAELSPHTHGGPYEIEISSGDEKIVLSDVLIGDVWIASGQSNMEQPLLFDLRGLDEAKRAYNENIRFYTCSRQCHPTVKRPSWAFGWVFNEEEPWSVCNEKSSLYFSAIGYYVAKALNKETNIPIGVIAANKGATKIDVFVPEKAFETDEYKDYKKKYEEEKIPDDEAEGLYIDIAKQNSECVKGYENKAEEYVRKMGTEAATVKMAEIPRVALSSLCKYHPDAPSMFYKVFIEQQLAPMSVCGVLWYQGESSRADLNYADKFKLMAKYWREAFCDEKLPFYTVEIAPHNYPDGTVAAHLRMEQWRAAKITEYTYITSTRDFGDLLDIHPNKKAEVSKNIANQILNYTYGIKKDCECASYKDFEIIGNKIHISLYNDEGLFGWGDENMKICGEDGVFVTAKSEYKNGKLIVWHEDIKEPKNVRYCYDAYYQRGRYFNKAGLALAPFTTELT